MRPLNNKHIKLMLGIACLAAAFYYSCFANTLSNQTVQQPTQNLEQIEDAEQLGHYLSNYYKNPQPDEIPKLIDLGLGDKQFLTPLNASIFMTFLTRVTKDNPEKITTWCNQIQISDPNKLAYIYRAIWDSNTQQGREFLKELVNGSDELLSKIATYITSQPPEEDVLEESLWSGSWVDRAWSAYGASGNNEYLKKILMIAASKNSTEIYADDELIFLATWSLNSMRQQDEIVDGKIKAIIADNPKLEYRPKGKGVKS